MTTMNTSFVSDFAQQDATPLLSAVVRVLRRPLAAVSRGRERARLEAELMSLDDRTLSDIGLSRNELHAQNLSD
jgi:uncharacterized protein YjiS (DUF1127 family)